mgnify:CR=1 FL=1
MATYQELVEQKKALDEQIETARKSEVSAAVAVVKRLIGEYGLTAVDCGFERQTNMLRGQLSGWSGSSQLSCSEPSLRPLTA